MPALVDSPRVPNALRFSHRAMATTFEIYIMHADHRYAQQASAAAFERLDELEQDLSRYIENSDVSRINNLPAHQNLPVELSTFECLQCSMHIYEETNGAFDITIGTLLDCWRRAQQQGRAPSESELAAARESTGTNLLTLDESRRTVRLSVSPLRIDLGGIGKGYALDQMAGLLREWSIHRAVIHGGRSTVLAIDAPPKSSGWPVAFVEPDDRTRYLVQLDLRNGAVSGSGVRKGQHIIDPRTARPVEGRYAAWVCAPSATTADALSTAFMIMAHEEILQYCSKHPEVSAMIAAGSTEREKRRIIRRYGRWTHPMRATNRASSHLPNEE